MKLDENEFFRQATLRICSSLDIEKALLNCLQYIRLFIPACKASLGLFDPDSGTLKNFALVDHAGNKTTLPPTQLPQEAIREIEAKTSATDIRIVDLDRYNAVTNAVKLYIDLSDYSALSMDLAVEGKRLGTFTVLAKGSGRFTPEHIHLISLLRDPFSIAMSNAVRYGEVVKLKDIVDAENRELNRELRRFSGDDIIGAEYGLKKAMEMVRQVAPLNSPVMLLGETGVGKEVVANAIHHTSQRKDKPFVKVNCGAIPESLMDSELFGHERGAFTGAISQKRGRFERADGGTIFLDEIGELPLQAQVKLLRVLQHKEIERVGGTRTIAVDVRIIAATNRDMTELVRAGMFREDLWFRLNVFPITLPPLRQRKEDIPALVYHFIEKKSRDLKLYPPPSVSAEAVDQLKAYHWPGNVRELENLIERELIRKRGKGKGGRLTFSDLDMPERTGEPDMAHEAGNHLFTLDEAVVRHIRRVLHTTNGKISGPRGAAQLLGINPNTLRSRMSKLGISTRYAWTSPAGPDEDH